MTIHQSEQFHETLLSQYRELIHEAILECEHEHKTFIDLESLNVRFEKIMQAAAYEGVSEEEIHFLIEEAQHLLVPLKKAV
jgi:hypothetical protein